MSEKRKDVLIYSGGRDSTYPSLAFSDIQDYNFTENGHLAFVAKDGTELVTNMDFIISYPTPEAIKAEEEAKANMILKQQAEEAERTNKIIFQPN